MNQNFCFGFTSPDDRLPIGKSGYPPILKHPPPRHQPPATHVTPTSPANSPTSHSPPTETTISLVNLKSKLPPKFQKYASFGIFPKLLLAPVAFLILLGFSLARPFVHIRLYRMVDTRIGHLATNTEMIRLQNLKDNRTGKKKTLIVYCSENWQSSNNILRKLFFRNSLHLRGSLAWLTTQMCRRIKIFHPLHTLKNQDLAIDFGGLIPEGLPTLMFSPSDQRQGEEFLKSCGITNTKFVCLHVRDSAYLKNKIPQLTQKHEFRDSEISTFVAAAETLADMGYTVLRMGSIVKEPLVSMHPRVIDYATNGTRTEFLDVYLGANCTFCVTTGSGWDSIPTIFRRPILFVNHLPLFGSSTITLSVLIHPKILVKRGSELHTLKQLIEMNAANRYNSQAYQDAGVRIRDMSSEELVEVVTEMAQRVEGTFVETQEQKEMQAKLKHILSTHPKLQPSPNYYPIRAQFASCFLSRYPNFLDGLD